MARNAIYYYRKIDKFMPSLNQIEFIKGNRTKLKEPVLIIGCKEYDFDTHNFIDELNKLGINDTIGIDIQGGPGVDVVLNICDSKNQFITKYCNYFNSVICMQTLYSVENPFKAAENIYLMMNKSSVLFFSDVFVHRIHRIPTDYWRFSYDAHKQLFKKLKFDDIKTKIGLTRQNVLLDMTYPFPELSKYKKQHNESSIEFIIRKLFRRIFFHSMINLPRLFPEISIFSISTKVD